MTQLIERKTTFPAGLQTVGGVATKMIECNAFPEEEVNKQKIEAKKGLDGQLLRSCHSFC